MELIFLIKTYYTADFRQKAGFMKENAIYHCLGGDRAAWSFTLLKVSVKWF